MLVKAVIFDLDGTLLDTIKDIANCMNLALAELSLPGFSEEDYKYLVGSGLDKLVDGVLPKERSDKATVDKFIGIFREAYSRKWKEHSVPFKGITELLDFLDEQGIKKAVLSNKPHLSTVKMAQALLPGYFKVVYGERVSDGFAKKPNPDVALSIAKAWGISPQQILFVGDSDVDMQVAVNAGMIGVGVLWGFRSKEELLSNGAKHLVSRPEEIMELIVKERTC